MVGVLVVTWVLAPLAGVLVRGAAVLGCPVSGVSTLSSDRGQNSEDLAGRHQPSSKEQAIYVWL